ncbi:tRNA (adenosine(37)-N6)-dimethylallyltransferase MiaA [Gammaproteobacteria bacterium LSUCC0057]|uniref:tRNA dimethylallyltransferase n=1 Tax=Gammaproteobacteria bacterium LSUCC0057 TaxID=2559237 RepID=A0A4Y8UH43_9GAMM|nr:tRNA (adenosine(37)-N6)-dimethylallyltransferase MiaA [Gammaproteobacteria bacterium LSUCC0057]
MSARKPPLLLIVGPTASGKTALAMALSDRLNGALISADSAQVYRGLSIGAAKPSAAELARWPHQLIDLCEPSHPFSVAEFVDAARTAIATASAAGQLPIVVGGSMLYCRALLEGLSPLPAADPALRLQLRERAAERGWPALHAELAAVDAATAAQLHPNHNQRIERALEVYQLTGRPLSQWHRDSRAAAVASHYQTAQLLLMPNNRALLHRRIEQRFTAMMAAGFAEEVAALYRRADLHSELPALRAAGYRQLWRYCSGELTLSEAVEQGIAATRQLAKRQLTWLRSWPGGEQLAVDDGERYFSEQEILHQALKSAALVGIS